MPENLADHYSFEELLLAEIVSQADKTTFDFIQRALATKICHFFIVCVLFGFEVGLQLFAFEVQVLDLLNQCSQLFGQSFLALGDRAEVYDRLFVLPVYSYLVFANEQKLLFKRLY